MMKKTLLSTAVAFALGMPFSVLADTAQTAPVNSAQQGGAMSAGVKSPATNEPSASYNTNLNGSANINYKDVANDVNTDNATNIAQDGIVIHAQKADQAVATSDLDSTVSGNQMVVDGAYGVSGVGFLSNAQTLGPKRDTTNNISASFSGAAGVSVVSQNTGSMSSIQQSTVVQSNFKLN